MNLISSSSHPSKWPLPLYERVCITFPPLKLPWHLRRCVSVQTAIFICKTELAFWGQRIKYQFCYCWAVFKIFYLLCTFMRWFPVSRSVMKAPWGQGLCPIPALPPFPVCTPLLLLPRLFQRSAHFSGKCGMPNNCFGDKSVQSTKQACGQRYSSKCIPSLTPCPCALQPVPAEIIVELGAPTRSKCLSV